MTTPDLTPEFAARGIVEQWLKEHDQTLIPRERLAELQLAERHADDFRKRLEHQATHDAGQLAMHVRDLMAAAGYHYDPDEPLHDQVRGCDQQIRDIRAIRDELSTRLRIDSDRHGDEVRRLTDLVDELRKQLAGADRYTVQLQEHLKDERGRVANLDRMLQERDAATPDIRVDSDQAAAQRAGLQP